MDFTLLPTAETDRTYLARLNFLTDVFGQEDKEVSPSFDEDYDYYVRDWEPQDGGFIAWEGNIPAGGVWLNWGNEDRHGFGYVSADIPELALAVEPRYRGQGVGTRLLAAAAELAQKLGCPGVSLSVNTDNERAHRLYLHLGFQPVSSSEDHIVFFLPGPTS